MTENEALSIQSAAQKVGLKSKVYERTGFVIPDAPVKDWGVSIDGPRMSCYLFAGLPAGEMGVLLYLMKL